MKQIRKTRGLVDNNTKFKGSEVNFVGKRQFTGQTGLGKLKEKREQKNNRDMKVTESKSNGQRRRSQNTY